MDEMEHARRRVDMARAVEAALGPFSLAHLRALEVVRRDRFVREEDVDRAEIDAPLPLDDVGHATISAPHAYCLSYRLLDLREGDRMLELGSGTGYGAALAAEIVGVRGAVITVEIDDALAARARELLADLPVVRTVHGDAADAIPMFAECNKVACAFAVKSLPQTWVDALKPGAVLVAPIGRETQHLVRVERDARGAISISRHGAVRYVANRSAEG